MTDETYTFMSMQDALALRRAWERLQEAQSQEDPDRPVEGHTEAV